MAHASRWAFLAGMSLTLLAAGCAEETAEGPADLERQAAPAVPAATATPPEPPAGRPAQAEPAEDSPEVVETYWPNGEPRLRKEVIRTAGGEVVNHGSYTRWFPTGQLEYQAVFVHGGKDGVVTSWHRNGRKWMEEHYLDGKRHGTTVTWDDQGRKRKEESHLNGRPHGTWTVWDSKGRVKHRSHFDNGTPVPAPPER